MPSRRHELLARAVPRIRGSRDLDSLAQERARLTRWHTGLSHELPTRLVPRFDRRFQLVRETLRGDGPEFTSWVFAPREAAPSRTVYYLHGGGFVAPIDPFHVRYAAWLSRSLGARVVMPDYPLAPEHDWRASHAALVQDVRRWAAVGAVTLAGDSAGGGLALALAVSLADSLADSRAAEPDAGGARADSMLLLSPWVDLTESTPETAGLDALDPWLFLSKLRAYAAWWAGSPEDLGRSEVSPALAPREVLARLPRTLMLCGTRDLLQPGCRMLATRGAGTGWPLTYVEEPDLIHVYPLLPGIPEAARARRTVLAFLRGSS